MGSSYHNTIPLPPCNDSEEGSSSDRPRVLFCLDRNSFPYDQHEAAVRQSQRILAPDTTIPQSTSRSSSPLPTSTLLPPTPDRPADVAATSPLPQPSKPIELVIHDFLTDDSASTTSSCPAAANKPHSQIIFPKRTSSLEYRRNRDRQYIFQLSVAPNDSISQVSRRRRTSAPERPAPMFGTNQQSFIHNWLDTITVDEGEKHSSLGTIDIRSASMGKMAIRKWSGMHEWEREAIAKEPHVANGIENQKKDTSAQHKIDLSRPMTINPPIHADNVAVNTRLDPAAFGEKIEELKARMREMWADYHQHQRKIEEMV